jgi:hypothetical protein
MENLKIYEAYLGRPQEHQEPIKNYGDYYPLTKVRIGDIITYSGEPVTVDDAGESIIKVTSIKRPDLSFRINQNMFNSKVFINAKR